VAEVSANRPGVIWIQEMLPKDQVIQYYSNATVFCCPSVYEPFGIINLEAMACETAVVASAVGGIPEVVVPGETGLLVDLELKPHV
jgi:glycosyltransferase involved in cell wall biosynthesis